MKINFKILVRSGLVVIISLLACGIIIYCYFTSIFTEQVINDETAKLQQTADQLQYVQDEVLSFSNTIIVNPRIRSNLKQYENAGDVDRVYAAHFILAELQTLLSLRNDIRGYAIVTPDGTAHWKSGTYDIKKEDWYREFRAKEMQSAFIKPPAPLFYSLPSDDGGREVLTFITKIRDYNETGRVIGEFIMELDLDKYRKLIDNSANGFDGFIWLIKDHAILYDKQYTSFVGAMPKLRELLQRFPDDGSFTFEGPDGHYYINQSIHNGWILLSYTPKRMISEKSAFVLYFVAVVIFFSTIVIISLLNPVIRNITKPISRLNQAMNQVAIGNLNVNVEITSKDEMENLGRKFNQMTRDLKKHIEESMEHERYKQEMKFNLMLSQIKPHFIYNTLNSVIYLARKQKYQDIVHLMSAFIHLLQDSIKLGEEEAFVSMKREVDIIKDYIRIQSYRYPHKFEVRWHIDPDLSTAMIPKYILQPLVENSLYHGIMPKDEAGTIIISILRNDREMYMSVEDDGVGMTEDVQRRLFREPRPAASGDDRVRHIGLNNVASRLNILYGNNVNIEVHSVPMEGTRVAIRLPLST